MRAWICGPARTFTYSAGSSAVNGEQQGLSVAWKFINSWRIPWSPKRLKCRLLTLEFGLRIKNMDMTVRTYDSLQEMKAEEYRYWQSRPAHERMNAVVEITLAAYAMKGLVPDVQRLQRTLVCLQRPQR